MTAAVLSAPRRAKVPWRTLAALVVVALLIGASVMALRLRTAPVPPDRWATAESRTVSDTVTATGTVRLRTGASVRVGAQISGLVRKLNVTVGSRVRRGEVIAEIDARPSQARAAQARAQLARTEVAAAKARADRRRGAELFAAGGLSAQQLDDLRGAEALAAASVEAARRDLAAASVDLNYVTIRAPIDGVVASVSTQQGETVASTFAAPTFVTVIQPGNLEVVATVDEADIGAVKVGQRASFTTETYPDREFAAVVERIAPDATLVSGVVNYEVTLTILGDVAALKPQMTVNATLVAATRRTVTAPAAAVRQGPEGRFVVVRRGATTVHRPVSVGAVHGADVEVTQGLAPGDVLRVGEEPSR